MLRKLVIGAVAGIGLLALAPAVHAANYTPTQAEFLGLEYVDFITEEDSAAFYPPVANGTASADFTFDVDWDSDWEQYRTAAHNTSFVHDFSALDEFSISFTNPSSYDGLPVTARIFVRTDSDLVWVGSSQVPINATPNQLTTVSLPILAIISKGGDPANVSSFGVEFFGDEAITDPEGMEGFHVTATASPPTPVLVNHLLYSWETPDNPSTADVDESLEGWGPGIDATAEPTVHTNSTHWASEGTHSMKVDRTYQTNLFAWGTEHLIDPYLSGGGAATGDYNENGTVDAADYTVWRDHLGTSFALPNRDPANSGNVSEADYTSWKANFGATGGGPDPAVAAELANIVGLLNDPTAYSIAFDLHVEDQYPNDNPGWFQVALAVGLYNNGHHAWYQGPEVGVDMGNLGTNPATITCEYLLSQLEDKNELGTFLSDGFDESTSYLAFHLSTNGKFTQGVPFTFYIDNFRIRTIMPQEGAGSLSGAAVPEPSAVVLALVAGLGAIGLGRRR